MLAATGIAIALGSKATWWALVAPGGALAVLAWPASKLHPHGWRSSIAAVCKYADMLLWVGRYAAVFALIGRPVSPTEALVVAVVSQVALLIPLAGNGMGIREWTIGLLALWGYAGGATETEALLADVVNRSAELMVALGRGIPAVIWTAAKTSKALAEAHRLAEGDDAEATGSAPSGEGSAADS